MNIIKITKDQYKKNLKLLQDELKLNSKEFLQSYSTKNTRLDFINYFKLDKNNLSPSDINFIQSIIPQINNIKKLTNQETNLLQSLKIRHEEHNIIFDNNKKKNWFAYLSLDLNNVSPENVHLINNLCNKESLFPDKVSSAEIVELNKLILKYTDNKPIEMYSNDSPCVGSDDEKIITNNIKDKLKGLLNFFSIK